MTHDGLKNKKILRKILFLSHKASRCGIHEFGVNVAQALKKSSRYCFEYKECLSPQEYFKIIRESNPLAVIVNYHTLTMPWLTKRIMTKTKLVHCGIMHEVTQKKADLAHDFFFHHHIAPDPTLILKNPIVFKTGRLIPEFDNKENPTPEIPIIGSFGFGLKGKGFEKILTTVQAEFDNAIVRFHIPFSEFADNSGKQARSIADSCQALIKKTGIKLELSHDFLSKEQLLNFLAQNTINVFFYDEYKGRGISSVIDYALAVKKPIAITQSTMFRHMFFCQPSICIEHRRLKQIIQSNITPLTPCLTEWTEANLIWDYERILDKIFSHHQNSDELSTPQRIVRELNKLFKKQRLSQWVSFSRNIPTLTHIEQSKANYSPITLPNNSSLNRILDNRAREQYKPAIDKLFELSPEMMAQKIPEANVQQAFVFDTIHRLTKDFVSPKILCVGSYMDTGIDGLKKTGYSLDEIDPVLNYDLNEFIHKPSTQAASYDMILCTSVIEHVKDDELFLTQIAQLLSPGGIAVLTCDYNDQYKRGDPLPSVDFRFYTQDDLKNRILPKLQDCSLIDTPNWNCPVPDFTYGKYRYTFATLVFQKNRI